MSKLILILLTVFVVLNACNTKKDFEINGYRFVNEYAEIDEITIDQLTGSITLDFLINLNSYPTTWTSIAYKFESDKKNEFNLRIKDKNEAQWYFGNGEKAFILEWSPKDLLPLNKWVRITAVRDVENQYMALYVDGVLKVHKYYNELTKADQTNSKIILMGRIETNQFLNATISSFRIWSKSLTSDDLTKSTMRIGKPHKNKNIIVYYDFNNIENSTVRDLSGSHRDLKIIRRGQLKNNANETN